MLDFSWSILAFIVAISVLVAVHEYGHFQVARWLGFKVQRFSIGFGRPLLRWRSADADGVEYQIAAIPLGGYVKMLDEREGDVPPEEAHRAFNRRPIPARIAVLAAGPGANFLFAIAAYWLMFFTGVDEITGYVGGVRADSVAAESGLLAEDVIESVGGAETPTLDQALVAMFDELLSDGTIELGVVGADGDRRDVILEVGDRVTELTEPDALFDGLGILIGPQLAPVVDSLTEDRPADLAGIRVGDRITMIDGEPIEFWGDLQNAIGSRPGDTVAIAVERDGRQLEFSLAIAAERNESGETVGRIGIGAEGYDTESFADRLYYLRRAGPIEGIGVAASETWRRTALSGLFLWRMVTGDLPLSNASGPVMIAVYAGDFAQAGFNRFLQFLAMISISLGIVNLLPVPILDGGQIVMCTIEAVQRKPLSMRAALIGQQIGLALLIALMGFVFYNDIARLLGS
jgi:regulator of sigma E protease